MKVIVGMSGGVDSSVTAYLLKEQGYEVEGLSFILYEARLKNIFPGCCSMESINDAARTAERIGIRHTALDLRDEFMTRVIEPFIDSYGKGTTPNPCILCNKYIKFPYLLKAANEKKAEFISTGHYARVATNAECGMRNAELGIKGKLLLKGIDPKKDQSYVLYVLRREELERLILPLGDKKKEDVRRIAHELDLPAADRPESQEICFIEDKKYFRLLDNVAELKTGPIIDVETGRTLGTHKGIHLYTVGQRKRMGIATGKPLYVVKIDHSQNAVYVGPKESAMMKEFIVENLNWFISSFHLSPFTFHEFRASVKVRSMMKDEPAAITVLDESKLKVVFNEPQWAPAPGQSAVFYDGETVIGGGVISSLSSKK